jgi:hypothetical protein
LGKPPRRTVSTNRGNVAAARYRYKRPA